MPSRPDLNDSLLVYADVLGEDPKAAVLFREFLEAVEALIVAVDDIWERKVAEIVEPEGYFLKEEVGD